MEFWQLAYEQKWISIEQLKEVVKTEKQPWGEITLEQFKKITNQDYTE